ncbi:MAG: mannose-1-phosphate guanylyltransferase [Clostridia bacterium]|nr:mannose-1-phosphate guanylyltransferase [Clostridia bacterium]
MSFSASGERSSAARLATEPSGTGGLRGVHVLIMAGGRGERFWPRSRRSLPKQFLRLCGEGTLLQETFRRARRLVPPERILVATPAPYAALARQQLPDLPADNLVLEPVGRDTAPCIGLAALFVERADPAATLLVLPADHVIAGEERFLSTLAAAAAVASGGRHLVTIGIPPTRPETGYGYIRCGRRLGEVHGLPVWAVDRFVEKPDRQRAEAFLAEGGYLWNSGLFAWRANTLRALIAHHLPWLHEGLERIAPALGTPRQAEVIAAAFADFPSISVDYGLMERASDVVVLPGGFGWDDVGTWGALERVYQQDADGNVTNGHVVAVDTEACVLVGADDGDGSAELKRLLVTFGVRGLVVVDTPDVVLVADKARTANLKALIEELRRRGLERYV